MAAVVDGADAGLVLEAPLGQGGDAVTWAARWRGAPAVVKLARRADPAIAARLAAEARALRAVGPPFAPRLLDDDATAHPPRLVMARAAGVPLAEVLAAAPLPAARALDLAAAIARAIAGVHGAGWIHADLAPGNVIVDGDAVQLVDFGLARPHAEARVAATTHVIATTAYAAPERLRGEPHDATVDLYALGVILHEALTGATPFTGDARAIERGHRLLRPPPLRRPDLPAGAEALVRALLAKRAARRPTAAADVAAQLAALAARAGSVTPRRPASPPRQAPPAIGPTEPPPGARPEAAVVLVAIAGDVAAADVDTLVQTTRGDVARRLPDVTIAAWVGHDADALHAAQHAAERLVARGAAVTLHAAHARLRRSPAGRMTLWGPPLDDPRWWRRGREGEIDATPAFTAMATPRRPSPALVGRERELAVLAAAATTAARDGAALATIRGAPGTGRTRLLAAATATLPGARVVATTADVRALAAALGGATNGGPAERAALVAAIADARARAAHAGEALVLAIDDVDRAEDELLDAIERAVIDAGTTPLWILVAAGDALVDRRPQWGARVERHVVVELGPLHDEAAVALLRALLPEADYAPVAALRGALDACGRRPRAIVEAALWLRQHAPAERGDAGGWRLAPDALDRLSTSALGGWSVRRALSTLPPEATIVTAIAAALGDGVTAEDVAAVLDMLDADEPVADPELALELAARAELVEARADGWAVLPGAIDAILDAHPAERVRALHRAALALPAPRRQPRHRARHAAALGDHAAAAAAWREAGEAALDAHRFVDAERALAAALEHARALASPPPWVAAAHVARARARAAQARYAQALDDAAAAIAVAAARGDTRTHVAALLEAATCHDLACDDDAAARAAREAAALAAGLDDPRLAVHVALAQARARWRQEAVDDAIAALGEVADAAARVGEPRPQTIALLLLAPALALAGAHDAAATRFDEVLALCEARGDDWHLGVALANRLCLWVAVGDVARAVADSERAIELARDRGQPTLEATALHNLAELRFRAGEAVAALPLARRARWLDARFSTQVPVGSELLVARILDDLGAAAERDELLAALAPAPPRSPTEALFEAQLRGALDDDALARGIAEIPEDDAVEALYRRAVDPRRPPAPALRARLDALAAGRPLWAARRAALSRTPGSL